ncbi:hypothetical protein [Paremcibacter congregatus]|uniref:hypothetical protein n=1 Tax=Paremcibacter congregatus TaxID=2043170 RepID=UPI0030ED0767
MKFETQYDEFISLSGWFNLIYTIPGLALLGICEFFEVPIRFWIPLFVIYLVGVLAHVLGMGFQSICVQLIVLANDFDIPKKTR